MPNIYGGGYDNYSTEEQIIGTWIDGKPIYQKSAQVTLPTITYGTWGQVKWDIASLNVNEIISLKYLTRQSTNQWTDGFYMDSGGYVLKALYINDTSHIEVISNNGIYSNGKCYITIQYTKTTD